MSQQPPKSHPASEHSLSQTATAFHEAGHAVMAFLLGRLVEKVTVSSAHLQTGGFRLGACKVQKGRSTGSNDRVEDEVLILLAGMVGESFATGVYCQHGAAQDLRAVRRILSRRSPGERQLERQAKRMLDKAEHLLSAAVPKEAVRLVARELLAKETISGRAVRHLFEQASRK